MSTKSDALELCIFRDNYLPATFTVTNADGGLITLAGCTVALYVKAKENDANADALITKTLGSGLTLGYIQNGAIVADPTGNKFVAEFQKADTTGFNTKRQLYFDVLITDANGHEFTVGGGSVLKIRLNVSR